MKKKETKNWEKELLDEVKVWKKQLQVEAKAWTRRLKELKSKK
jgi:hypothetical protein